MLTLKVTGGPGGAREIEVSGARYVVGREEGSDLVLGDDEEVSREHAAFGELPDGRLTIEDLGSRNGTFVNGHRLTGPVSLSGGEEIKIGTTTFSVVQPRAGETKASGPGETRVAPPPVVPTPAPPTPPQGPPATPPQAAPPPQTPPAPPPQAAPSPQTPPPPQAAAPPPQAAQQPRGAARPPARPQPRPPVARRPATPSKSGGGGRIAAVIGGIVVLLLVIGAVVMTFFVWGGTSQTLYRLGIGGGWDDATVSAFTDNCGRSGGTESQCNCLVDELQKRLSQGDADAIKAANDAGTTPPNAGDITDAVTACDIPISPPA